MSVITSDSHIVRQFEPLERQPVLPIWALPVAAVVIFAAGIFGVRFAPQGSQVAVWWPAAGLAVLLMLLTPPGRRRYLSLAVILVATAAANAVAGRPLHVAAAFAVANTIEAFIVSQLLLVRGGHFQLRSLGTAMRFVGAVVLGAGVIGVLAGVTVSALEGGVFFPTAPFVAASHAAAVLMIAPFGMLPRRVTTRAGLGEVILQVAVLLAVVALVFLPTNSLPAAFLPYPVIAWAAFRFTIHIVIPEALLASLLILVLTVVGRGPFNRAELDLATRAALAETFLVTFAGFAVVIVAAQYELRITSRQLAATSRLLSGSLLEASVGLAIAERESSGNIRIGWNNPTAATFLTGERGKGWEGPVAKAALDALDAGTAVTVELDDGRTLSIAANRIPEEHGRFAVQIVDMTEPLRMQAVTLAAEREHEAARSTRVDLERQRDDFVATTSHELRTPITSIVGYSELLADSKTLTDEERSWVDVITRNGARLSDLVEDLLVIGKIRNDDGFVDAPTEIDLASAVREVLHNVQLLADRRGVVLIEEKCEGTALANADDVHRILTNLFSNAVKFTPEQGTVTVRAQQLDNAVSITVADTGPGMSEDAIQHAYDRFYRAPEAERQSVPGTGLGLAIVSELVTRNKGTISLTSPSSGGLVATVTLPSVSAATS